MKVLADIDGRLVATRRLSNGSVALVFKMNEQPATEQPPEQLPVARNFAEMMSGYPVSEQERWQRGQDALNDKMRAAFAQPKTRGA